MQLHPGFLLARPHHSPHTVGNSLGETATDFFGNRTDYLDIEDRHGVFKGIPHGSLHNGFAVDPPLAVGSNGLLGGNRGTP